MTQPKPKKPPGGPPFEPPHPRFTHASQLSVEQREKIIAMKRAGKYLGAITHAVDCSLIVACQVINEAYRPLLHGVVGGQAHLDEQAEAVDRQKVGNSRK